MAVRKSQRTAVATGAVAAKAPEGLMVETRVVVKKGYDELLERGYGRLLGKSLELSFVEALYLLAKGRLIVKTGKKAISFNNALEQGMTKDPRLHVKYIAYSDLRDRGLLVKTGFKFGCDFRVYQRGVTLKRGPKSPEEHTKWVVFTVPEDHTCSFQELSRAVRLAHSIRAKMLWAVVDNESNVTYYSIMRSVL